MMMEIKNQSVDKEAIDLLIKSFYGIFYNKLGHVPNAKSIDSLCIPELLVIKKDGLGDQIYNRQTFIEPRIEMLKNGTLVNFEEYEIAEETKISNHIAFRHSSYKKQGIYNGLNYSGSGIKMFQLIKRKEGWMINSVIWEDVQR